MRYIVMHSQEGILKVTKESVIQVPLSAVLWGAGILAGVFVAGVWGVALFVLGEVKDDIQATRQDVSELRAGTDAKTTMLVSEDSDLSKSISDLVAQLTINNAQLGSLNENIGRIDATLAASVKRQEEFERYVVTRLPAPTSLPAQWLQNQKEIVTTISGLEVDPLTSWYKSFAIEQ
jgi:hypothetical protein